ncbi:RING zinc finger protein, putative [Plasmodium yoelii]|uniref:RING zinc finger protein n=2 Tax=Plasmodium yoelii TaxID=5861 RepID=A0AAE9WUA8_PLAYO|nr:RING zinc finger protein, putative [Plasmodium yoelii]WBY60266.1 RING zinc finger protein [Plasmodium yoelii yoelii]CDU20154.1 conserved Plasmodium protein, unknown function [Plasmodium yoelii]VTZ80912.1 RING zinc finger protein, putative [Plasmodium yoelii]|eukprot:XP_729174.2 RING zinc finger protein, putative [Plasmodium yoelii]
MHIFPECCICRLSLKNNLCVEKNCGNVFHHSCIKKWISVQKTCPLCKCVCYKKNLLYIHYEINEDKKLKTDENTINKSKDELYADLIKFETELIKEQNENEKYSLEILTLTNKNKILTDTINKNNIKIKENEIEKLKLKELKDEYLKEKLLLTTKVEEYDKELKKYKIIEKYLDKLNKEDLNKFNLLFGLNILSLEEQQNVILNYIKNCLDIQKKHTCLVKNLKKDINEKNNQIQTLKEKLYKYKLDGVITDSNDNQISNDENNSKTKIIIKNKIIRRIKTIDSENENNTPKKRYIISSKSKISSNNIQTKNNNFIHFIDKQINNSYSSDQLNSTPSISKTQTIEMDLFKGKSVENIFNTISNKKNILDNNQKKPTIIINTKTDNWKNKTDIQEIYSIPTDSSRANTPHSNTPMNNTPMNNTPMNNTPMNNTPHNNTPNTNVKTKATISPTLKRINIYKIKKSKNSKLLIKQSTKITDFFKKV